MKPTRSAEPNAVLHRRWRRLRMGARETRTMTPDRQKELDRQHRLAGQRIIEEQSGARYGPSSTS